MSDPASKNKDIEEMARQLSRRNGPCDWDVEFVSGCGYHVHWQVSFEEPERYAHAETLREALTNILEDKYDGLEDSVDVAEHPEDATETQAQ